MEQQQPDLEAIIGLPMETTPTHAERRRLAARHSRKSNSSFSWTKTDIRFVEHCHDWIVRGFSQTDARYLETTFSVRDDSSVYMEPLVNHTFKIRLHPQGNKSSNLEFSFFQIFSLAQNAKFKAKFYVYNSQNEEIQTTTYSGAQQLNGFFQYVRRNDLLKHIELDDELRLSVSLTSYSDTLMKHGSYFKKEQPDIVNHQDESLPRDYETIFNSDRFSDFKILVGERQQPINAHRVVLAARSQYFSALLMSHTKEFTSGVVEFPDVDFEVFSELIYWIYTGKSPRIRLYALDLLVLCDRFQVNALKDLAAKVLKENLRSDNVCDVLIKSEMHNVPELKEAALLFIVENSATILKTSQWESLLSEQPRLVTEICLAMSNDVSKQGPMEPMNKRLRIG